MHKTVILSDQKECKVRVLGLFELSGMVTPPFGPYRYSMLMATGQILEDEYIFPDTPPQKPEIDNPEKGSYEYFQLQEWETYQAARAYESKRVEDYERYLREISEYILKNCLNENDRQRIIEPSDYDKIQRAAIVPQLTEEVLADTLRNTFQSFIW